MKYVLLLLLQALISCNLSSNERRYAFAEQEENLLPTRFEKGSWPYFLQHLPTKTGTVVDYQGNAVANQSKAVMIVNYDVGNKDLQQCADALIRLRAEYLFSAHRLHEIAFHFTSGHLYTFDAYCKGLRPSVNGNQVSFPPFSTPCEPSHAALRRYLDIVYTYAGTISLARELHETDTIAVGTVIILPGSPGHCMLVVDEATTPGGEKMYKLAEGYSPAQSIYILRNAANPGVHAWQPLKAGHTIETASYSFYNYQLGSFE